MRASNRNKQKFYYALQSSTTAYVDEYGNETGDLNITYGAPVEMWANISPASGEAGMSAFGIRTDYEKVIVTCDMNCPITESSILWIGKEATVNSVVQPHNYAVSIVAKSLNSIVYGVKEVSAS